MRQVLIDDDRRTTPDLVPLTAGARRGTTSWRDARVSARLPLRAGQAAEVEVGFHAPPPRAQRSAPRDARGTSGARLDASRAIRCLQPARGASTRRAACAASRRASSCRTPALPWGRRRRAPARPARAPRVLTGADVEVRLGLVVPHQEQAGVGEVVDVQELPPRAAGAHTTTSSSPARGRR